SDGARTRPGAGRCGCLRSRAEGGRDRRRGRGGRDEGDRPRVRRQRRRGTGLGRGAAATRGAGNRWASAGECPRMTGPRHADPLPLGGGDGLPYSKGLMARALMAAGVPAVRAYELALRVGVDLAERGEDAVELDRLEELAVEVLGENEGVQA